MDFKIEKLENFTGHKGSVYTLCEGPEPGSFYSSGEDGMVVKWDTKKADLGTPVAKMERSVYAIHFITEKNILVVAHNFFGIHFIDIHQNKEIAQIKIPNVSFFDIKQISGFLLIAQNDGGVQIIDTENFKIINTIKLSDKSARRIAINPNNSEIAVAYSDFNIRIFEFGTFELKRIIQAHDNSVFALVYDDQMLVSGSRDARIKMWDTENNFQNKFTIPAHLYAINDLITINEKNILLSCSMDKSIKIWQNTDLKLLKVINKAKNAGHGTSINKLLWLPETQVLLSASDDRSISMWNLFYIS